MGSSWNSQWWAIQKDECPGQRHFMLYLGHFFVLHLSYWTVEDKWLLLCEREYQWENYLVPMIFLIILPITIGQHHHQSSTSLSASSTQWWGMPLFHQISGFRSSRTSSVPSFSQSSSSSLTSLAWLFVSSLCLLFSTYSLLLSSSTSLEPPTTFLDLSVFF